MKFSLYFMGYESAEDIPRDETERTRWTFSRKATVELTQLATVHTYRFTGSPSIYIPPTSMDLSVFLRNLCTDKF